MVTKLRYRQFVVSLGYILAKNHMVTKQELPLISAVKGYILAKNHMVTKQIPRTMRLLRVIF